MKERRESEQEPERVVPVIPARRPAGLTEHLLRLQAMAGNAAVARALARTENDEEETSDAERAALYYTALKTPAPSEPFEEIGGLFAEPEPVEDPLPFPGGVEADAPAAAAQDNTALYYAAVTPPPKAGPEPFENLRGFFPSEKEKPQPLEGLEGTKLFNEPKPPKQKAKAPPQPAYNPLGFLGQNVRAAPVQVVPPPVAKPAAKPAPAKPPPAKPPPAFVSHLTAQQQAAVATESQRMIGQIERRLEQGVRGNQVIDIGVPSAANYDVKHWLRDNYEGELAPVELGQGRSVRYHIVTDAQQRTKIDVTGHVWSGGRDRTQGGGQNVFNFHVEWAQHW